MFRKVKWLGGPLDGAMKNFDSRVMMNTVWMGPDPAHPTRFVVVYLLHSDGHYHFDQGATDRANEHRPNVT